MEPLAEKALKAVEKGELTIMPERFEEVYNATTHFRVIIVCVYSMIHMTILAFIIGRYITIGCQTSKTGV